MSSDTEHQGNGTDPLRALKDTSFFKMQEEAMKSFLANGAAFAGDPKAASATALTDLFPQDGQAGDLGEWAKASAELQQMWLEFATYQAKQAAEKAASGLSNPANLLDPAQWLTISQGMLQQMPKGLFEAQAKLAQDSFEMWHGVLGRMGLGIPGFGPGADDAPTPETLPALPKKDRRFSDPAWQQHPAFALLHQSYLMLTEYFRQSVQSMEGLDSEKRRQLEFAVNALAEAMSPGNFILTNPVVMKRTVETKGRNLVNGMRHLIADLKRGQLTHTDPNAFTLGENLASTPGKVVHETPLYQLIQYTPSTKEVLDVPLVIFPPWINRFYILDLNPKKSFVKWAVDQGISVFMVSWKSADASLADVVWDDYIRAQMEAIDHIRDRLKVPQVHTIGYCVAGTTLAATLAIMARRGEAEKVKSATFFTAQVDFEEAGDLKHFVDDGQIEMIGKLGDQGYLDGRYLAATFNALRGKDLIWNYVVNNYLLGEDYPAFDLLHWNGDVTNLPAKWHVQYLCDLYRDNKMVVPDALEADETPIDLTKVSVPTFVQAGREDHIAPAQSVWRITEHFQGPVDFLLAGSGHIAGVVNPPTAKKYQYWLGDSDAPNLEEYIADATEHPGSWWPHWFEWLTTLDDTHIDVSGKRKPGGRGDSVIEDAPGRYVKSR